MRPGSSWIVTGPGNTVRYLPSTTMLIAAHLDRFVGVDQRPASSPMEPSADALARDKPKIVS